MDLPCSTGSCKELRSIAGYCKSCWIKRTAARKAREAEKKVKGECTTCPQPVAKGKKRCYDCLEKYRLQCRAREQSRVAEGLCALCGLAPLSGTSRTCSRCFCRNVSRFHFKTTKRTNELIQLLADQGGRCPYTGKDLVLGNNCSLDHKTPVSRGGTHSTDNLQWVYCFGAVNVNSMKWTMTDAEFKALIREVSSHISGSVHADSDEP